MNTEQLCVYVHITLKKGCVQGRKSCAQYLYLRIGLCAHPTYAGVGSRAEAAHDDHPPRNAGGHQTLSRKKKNLTR